VSNFVTLACEYSHYSAHALVTQCIQFVHAIIPLIRRRLGGTYLREKLN